MSTKQIKKPVKKPTASKKTAAKKQPCKKSARMSLDLVGIDPETGKKAAELHVADIVWGNIKPELIEELGELISQLVGLYLSRVMGSEEISSDDADECCCSKKPCVTKAAKKPIAKKAKKVTK